MQSIAKQGYLTAITCWNSGNFPSKFKGTMRIRALAIFSTNLDVSFNFYVAFNDVNRTTVALDNQITIANVDDANLPETMDLHNEFILIDLQCQNSFEILLKASKNLQNHYWILLNMDGMHVRTLFEMHFIEFLTLNTNF